MDTFSTRGLAARRKLAYWNALSNDAFAAMEVTPRNLASFDGALRRERVGPLTLLDVRSAAVRIEHTRGHVLRTTAPSFLLLTPLRGSFRLRIDRDPALCVSAGEYCLIDHGMPYELHHGDAVRTLCIDIPRASLHAHMAQPDAAVGRHMRPDNSLSRLLGKLLMDIGAEMEPDASPRFTPAVAEGLLGFVAAAYGADNESAPLSGSNRRRALVALIHSRASEPGLTPGDIAREFGISTRRLRALLAHGGESFQRYLLRRRLDRSAELLRDPARRHLSVTQIAFDSGFSNATHFGAAFKRLHGVTPRHFRLASATSRQLRVDPGGSDNESGNIL